jgi:hypothetical protein
MHGHTKKKPINILWASFVCKIYLKKKLKFFLKKNHEKRKKKERKDQGLT